MAAELLGGRYELRGILGRGGMAEVRDGWDTRLDRAVAIKLLHPGLSAQPDSRRRFEAEAKSAAGLTHPNIVAVHDSGEHSGTPYIVMERLPGRSLADVIACGPVPQPLLRRVLDQVLAALTVAHEAGILHRDIKPGNILFADSGDAKVADFGIAKSADIDQTVTGQIVGTMAYLSPERIAGRTASVGDDLYALGVVGYEALTGRRPFVEENMGALARAIMDHRPTPVAALRPDVDPSLAAVIERAMARWPEQRFHSARHMRGALSGSAFAAISPGTRPSGPWPPGPWPPGPWPPGTRPPTMVLTSAVPPLPTYVGPHVGSQRNVPSNKKLLMAGAGLIAIAIAAVAFAMDSASQGTVPAVTSSSLLPPPPPPPPSISPVTSSIAPPPVDEPGFKRRGPGGKGGHHGD